MIKFRKCVVLLVLKSILKEWLALDSLRCMARVLTHRGPDGEGFYEIWNSVGLANRRLSIIDLVSGY